MMKTPIFFSPLLAAVLFLSGCELDNYDAPASVLKGNVVYNGQPLNVRSNASGIKLELWQRGYALFTKIPVNIDHDGSFSASLFDGDYKLTRLKGAPWADNTDTINVQVRGTTILDVPVDPYFVINNASFQKNGTGSVTATFHLQRVNTSRQLELARVYLGQTIIVDQNNNAAAATVTAAAMPDLSQPITASVTIPAVVAGQKFIYARVGVKVAGVAELLYSAPQPIQLN
jgi:hypothetical protein